MKTSEVIDRYKELCDSGKFICSQSELRDFKLCGLVLETGKNKYVLRNTDIKKIIVLDDLEQDFDIDFSSMLNIDLKPYNTNKIYYMSESTYNKYKENNLIVSKGEYEYYRLFANELWLVRLL